MISGRLTVLQRVERCTGMETSFTCIKGGLGGGAIFTETLSGGVQAVRRRSLPKEPTDGHGRMAALRFKPPEPPSRLSQRTVRTALGAAPVQVKSARTSCLACLPYTDKLSAGEAFALS